MKICWKDIEVNGRPTGAYVCSQHLRWMLAHDEPLTGKFIAQKSNDMILDMTLEDVYIDSITPELEEMLNDNKFVVLEHYNGFVAEEDPPTIVVTDKTKFYPVNFVDY